jgi:hypothetical protein
MENDGCTLESPLNAPSAVTAFRKCGFAARHDPFDALAWPVVI